MWLTLPLTAILVVVVFTFNKVTVHGSVHVPSYRVIATVTFLIDTIPKKEDTKTGTIVGCGTERGGLYYVDEIAQQSTTLLTHGSTTRKAWLLHRRLGHPSIGYLKLMFPKLASGVHSLDCETCHLAKSHRHSFKLNNTRMSTPFSLIHSDVWGPAPINGGLGLRYFLLFIDDFSRMTWVYSF